MSGVTVTVNACEKLLTLAPPVGPLSVTVTVIVADVSGKGISAALLASVIHGMFYAQISTGTRLVEAVAAVNRFLCSRVAGQKYATLLAAQLHSGGRLEIVNCGHVPPILVAGGVSTQVRDGDLPVGLLADAQFHPVHRDFQVGSRLCIITDGIPAQDMIRVKRYMRRYKKESRMVLTGPNCAGTISPGKAMLGIYKLEGDRLTICIPDGDKSKRPGKFEAGKGSDHRLLVFERPKP